MAERLSRFGVGPRLVAASLSYCALAAVLTWTFRRECLIAALTSPVIRTVAILLVAVGMAIWILGIVAAMRAYNRDELVTTGIFGLVRHPIYSAWMVFALPGLCLLTTSWPFLLTPLVAYAVFKRSIHVEDKYLTERFGQAYLDYRRRVNEVLPIPRLGRPRPVSAEPAGKPAAGKNACPTKSSL
jgi:protein-S-isoprenylcysteine O-methyltransferase Ste14